MIDYMRIETAKNLPFAIDFCSGTSFEWLGAWFNPAYHKKGKGVVKWYEGEVRGLSVYVHPDKIRLNNSLHKFSKGNNYSDFSFSEMKKAIDELCSLTEVPAHNWRILKLEFGLNIHTRISAKEYLDCILSHKGREFEKMKDNHIYYGKKCYKSEYAMKIYDKSFQVWLAEKIELDDNILRIEMCYNRKRKLPKGVETLADLQNEACIKALFSELKEAIDKIIYKERTDFTSSTFEERVLFFASLSPDFIKAEKRINKDQAKATNSKISQLRERFFRKEFKKFLLKSLNDKYIHLFCT